MSFNDSTDKILGNNNERPLPEISEKPNLDRGLNVLAGVIAIPLGIYLTAMLFLGAGYAGPIYFFTYLILGPLLIISGIHLFRKKVDPQQKVKVNLPRALLFGLGLVILAFYLWMN